MPRGRTGKIHVRLPEVENRGGVSFPDRAHAGTFSPGPLFKRRIATVGVMRGTGFPLKFYGENWLSLTLLGVTTEQRVSGES